MNRVSLTLLVALFALTACQKAAEEKSTPRSPAESSRTESVTDDSTAPAADTPAEIAQPKNVEYRIVRAKVYRSEQAIEILVPEDIDVDSSRLIEYEEGEDGRYYFVSLIPQ